jgi:hypothetical protein
MTRPAIAALSLALMSTSTRACMRAVAEPSRDPASSGGQAVAHDIAAEPREPSIYDIRVGTYPCGDPLIDALSRRSDRRSCRISGYVRADFTGDGQYDAIVWLRTPSPEVVAVAGNHLGLMRLVGPLRGREGALVAPSMTTVEHPLVRARTRRRRPCGHDEYEELFVWTGSALVADPARERTITVAPECPPPSQSDR